MTDELLDGLFLGFHTILIVFNLTGWLFRRTRKAHLITITLTLLSWVILGIFYGWGYCPCTDWHWQVKRRLGETGLPPSYIKYYLDMLTGHNWNTRLVDGLTAALGIGTFVASLILNLKDRRLAQSVHD